MVLVLSSSGKASWRSPAAASSLQPCGRSRPRLTIGKSGTSATSSGAARGPGPGRPSAIGKRGLPAAAPPATSRRRPAKEEIAARRVLAAGAAPVSDYLNTRRVGKGTAQYYRRGHDEVTAFAKAQGLEMQPQLGREAAMRCYLRRLFFHGDSIFSARSALYGYAFVAHLNLKDVHELAQSKLCLAGFSRAAPGEQRDPMPWEAAMLLCRFLLQRQLPLDRLVAEMVVVMFDGYLRLSEILSLLGGHITVLPKARTLPYTPVSISIYPMGDPQLAGPRTKSGEYDDTIVFGTAASKQAGRGFVADLLRRRKALTRPTARAYEMNAVSYTHLTLPTSALV